MIAEAERWMTGHRAELHAAAVTPLVTQGSIALRAPSLSAARW